MGVPDHHRTYPSISVETPWYGVFTRDVPPGRLYGYDGDMSDSFLDHLANPEREKIRKRMRSEAAYEKLRERVKGPEDLEREMERSDRMAEAHLALESDSKAQEKAKEEVQSALEDLFEEQPSPEVQQKIAEGNFKVAISSHPSTHEDVMTVVTEGNVQEKIPLKSAVSDKISQSLIKKV